MNGLHTEAEDKTVPPRRLVRYNSPAELYEQIPEIGEFTVERPDAGEDNYGYLERLRASEIPEDAVAFAAFATEPQDAIAWASKAMRSVLPELSQQDVQLLRWIEQWLEGPSDELRWRILQIALFAPERSPAVYLGLAVGWSGGPLAPNDPSVPPRWRAPRAVTSALLGSVSRGNVDHRRAYLARALDLASGMFRVY